MNANMKSKLSLKDLLDPNLSFSVEAIAFQQLTEISDLDNISLVSPIHIHRLKDLIEQGIQKALPGAVIIMVPEDFKQTDTKALSSSASEFDPFVIAENLKKAEVACVFVTENAQVSENWFAACQHVGLPLIAVEMNDKILTDTLLELFHMLTASTQTIHGNMMDLFGVGILILGRSGIGKSECCLDLIMKGHRLVADDSTLLYKNRQGGVTATASRTFAGGWMEIRGVGIIDVDVLFGIAALRKKKDLHVVVELMDWPDWKAEMKKQGNGRLSSRDLGRFLAREPGDSGDVKERNLVKSYLGIDIPLVQIPVGPGRSIANLIEVAARKQLMEFSISRVRTKSPSGNCEGIMIGIMIVTHGSLADEIMKTCFKIIGERDNVGAYSIQWDDDPTIATRRIEKLLKKLDQGDGVLVLTDMFGGTPTNIMISLSKNFHVEIVTGVNLPMLIKAVTTMSTFNDLAEFAEKVKLQGQKNIYKVSDILSMKRV